MAMTAAQLLEQFLSPGGGNVLGENGAMQANDALIPAGLRHSRDMENRTRMIHEPDNKSWQLADQLISQDEAADPYSDTNVEKRNMADQSALDEAHRFFLPDAVKMRAAQGVEKGAAAGEVAYHTAAGKESADYSSQTSGAGPEALDAASQRIVAQNAARVKPATPAVAPINWPPGTAKYRPEASGWQGPLSPAQQALQGPTTPQQPPVSPEAAPQPQAHNAAGGLDPTDTPDVKALFDSQGVDDGGRSVIRAILNYDYPIPAGMPAARSPELQKYLKIAEMIDPNFNEGTYASGQTLRKSMTSGPLSDKIQALQALAGHTGDLEHERVKLNNANFGSGAINPFMNWMYQKGLGWSAPNDFEQNKGLVDAETAKVLAGTTPTNELRNSLAAQVDSNSSDDQIKGFVEKRKGLLGPQDDAIRAKLSAFPRLLQQYDQIITDKTRQMLAEGQQHNAPAAAPAPGTRRSGAR